jgi:hypothetical protein
MLFRFGGVHLFHFEFAERLLSERACLGLSSEDFKRGTRSVEIAFSRQRPSVAGRITAAPDDTAQQRSNHGRTDNVSFHKKPLVSTESIEKLD